MQAECVANPLYKQNRDGEDKITALNNVMIQSGRQTVATREFMTETSY